VRDLVIIGTGGNSVNILDAVLACNEAASSPIYQVRGFLDDDKNTWDQSFEGYPVLGPLFQAAQYPDCFFVNGIGSFRNYWRKPAIIGSTKVPLDRFETVVHPNASVSRFASLGPGTVVLQNATINSRAKVGSHVMIQPGAVVGNSVAVGDYSCIASAACVAGKAQIGKACYVGANSSVAGQLQLGDGSLVGMGAVVLEDVPQVTVVVGNPARAIRSIC
jgi:sugar O-acyltransferase (sialic acid O-acetyltransferase NeuD family)